MGAYEALKKMEKDFIKKEKNLLERVDRDGVSQTVLRIKHGTHEFFKNEEREFKLIENGTYAYNEQLMNVMLEFAYRKGYEKARKDSAEIEQDLRCELKASISRLL